MDEVKFERFVEFFEHVQDGKWNYYPNTDAGREAYITVPPRLLKISNRNFQSFRVNAKS